MVAYFNISKNGIIGFCKQILQVKSILTMRALATSPIAPPACALTPSMPPVPGMWRATLLDGLPAVSPTGWGEKNEWIVSYPYYRPLIWKDIYWVKSCHASLQMQLESQK